MAATEALDRVCKSLNLPFVLKKEQVDSIVALSEGKDTFVVLPAGYGKSLIYTLQPLLMDEVDI